MLDVYPLELNSLFGYAFFHVDQAIPQLNKRLQNLNIKASETAAVTRRALPKDLPIQVQEVIPRLKEGRICQVFSRSRRRGLRDRKAATEIPERKSSQAMV